MARLFAKMTLPYLPSKAASQHLISHFSLYHAVVEGRPVQYGAENARRDQEILIALRESASTGNRPIALPLRAVTAHEQAMHARYREQYGHDPLDVSEEATRRLYPRRGVKQTVGN